ncbi:general stress protein [Paenibacillus glycanilyticus]|uniref:General stress protein 17M-like domain-containing protein n=1 Tax=Paenibacillus glycanilyticus TaxID=126569 RepID=A0ABQ6G7P5_9BACL|nr:general stress protein [Paenibacillus glycanilyticus]GLX66278.1 hypothetical protein MU1_06220 [Paenibacillus glycanilyticus]
MAKLIGAFASQQQVIDTVNSLEQAGFVQGELKILAKNSEHSRRIESESDVHVDELSELASTNEADGDHNKAWTGAAFIPAIGLNGGGSWNSGFAAAGFTALGGSYTGDDTFGDEDSMESAMRALGLDEQEAASCRDSIREGAIIVVVNTDESKSILDKDGGPNLSRLGIAEGIYRQNGATRIFSGT